MLCTLGLLCKLAVTSEQGQDQRECASMMCNIYLLRDICRQLQQHRRIFSTGLPCEYVLPLEQSPFLQYASTLTYPAATFNVLPCWVPNLHRFGGHGLFLLADVAAGTELLAIPRSCMLEPHPATLCSCWSYAHKPCSNIREQRDSHIEHDRKGIQDSAEISAAALSVEQHHEQQQQQHENPASFLASIAAPKLPRIQLASALLCNVRRQQRKPKEGDDQYTCGSPCSLGEGKSFPQIKMQEPATTTTTHPSGAEDDCSSWETDGYMQPALFAAYSSCLPAPTDLQHIPLLWPCQVSALYLG